jgi:small-conductance mechanosensitive channel
MNSMPLASLLTDLLHDLRAPGMMWQTGAIAACVVVGWGIASIVRRAIAQRAAQPSMVRFGVESFTRVLAPLLIVLLLLGAKYFLSKWQSVNLLRIALPIFGSLALIRFAFYLLRRVFSRQGRVGSAIRTFDKIFALLAWAAVALYITGLWPDLFQYLDNTTLPLGKHKASLAAILQALASVAVMLMLALWAGTALEDRLMTVQGLHSSLRVVMGRLGRAVLILVAVLVSLSLVGIDLTVLSVFGGALGVGLGLGLQKIASNYVSGFVILLDRSLMIGDMIQVDKFYGRVTQINTRYTVLQGLDGIDSVLPNEMLVSGPVQNYSLSTKTLRLATQVSVSYDSDLDLVLPLMEQAAAGAPRVSTTQAPYATLVRFGADGLDLDVGFWIEDPENGRGGVVSDVNRAIWRAFKEHQISVPFPQREVRIIGLPAGFTAPADSQDAAPLVGPLGGSAEEPARAPIRPASEQ